MIPFLSCKHTMQYMYFYEDLEAIELGIPWFPRIKRLNNYRIIGAILILCLVHKSVFFRQFLSSRWSDVACAWGQNFNMSLQAKFKINQVYLWHLNSYLSLPSSPATLAAFPLQPLQTLRILFLSYFLHAQSVNTSFKKTLDKLQSRVHIFYEA